MKYEKEIFRAYDIRGIYPDQLSDGLVDALGRAFGTQLVQKGLKTVVVGRDDRPSSLSLINSLTDGLMSAGISVINTGVTVQPAMHYFTFLEGIDASINVTASHNPGKYNGIKIDMKRAVPFFGEALTKLHEEIENGGFITGKGDFRQENLNPKYIDFISSKFKLTKPIKVVVYCGNGATSEIYPKVLEKIGAQVVPLRCYLDAEFPAGVPDPESGNFYPELRAQVLESKAAVGVGFDSDGDRVGEVDEKGNYYRADEIFLLYVKEALAKHPGATIIYDVKCSQLVEKYIKSHGGLPKLMPTGRAYFLEKMFEGSALLGCEFSGHTYFKDEFDGFDDGIYSACRLLRIMDQTGAKLSGLMREFPKMVSTPELKYPIEESKKFETLKRIVNDVKANKKYLDVNVTDGVRVKVTENSWFLIRASNTSALLSVRVEAETKGEVEEILKTVTEYIEKNLTI